MEIVYENGRSDHEIAIRVTAPSATVGDLAAELAPLTGDSGGSPRLHLGGRPLDPEMLLAEAGLVRGSVVSARSERGTARNDLRAKGVVELVFLAGPEAGRSQWLADGLHVVGRGKDAAVRVNVQSVSRRHCALSVAGSVLSLEDLDSSGGTFLDGEGVLPGAAVPLDPQSVVEVGDCAFSVRPRRQDDRSVAVDPLRHAGPSGEIPFNRPPRRAPPGELPPVAAPKAPAAETKAPFNLIAVLGPAAMGTVLGIVSNPLYALMALASPVMAIINLVDSRRRSGKAARTSDRNFRAELEAFSEQLTTMTVAERRRRLKLLPDLGEVTRRATLPSTRLWERRLAHPDFLTLTVAYADQNWTPPVKTRDYESIAPEVTEAISAHSTLKCVPVGADLATEGPVGIVGPRPAALAAARALLIQAAVHHGPSDLQCLVATNSEHARDWDWAKWLPHVRDLPNGDERLLFSSAEDVNVYLGDRLRKAGDQMGGIFDKVEGPMFLAVVDAVELTRNRNSQVRALLRDRRIRSTAIVVAPSTDQLPEMCTSIVELDSAGSVATVSWPATGTSIADAVPVGCSEHLARTTARLLARFEDPEIVVPGSGLPSLVRITPLLGLDKIGPEEFDARWSGYHRSVSALAAQDPLAKPPMAAVVGMTQSGSLGLDVVLDGPHGMVGGTTGSGKTELLRSFVLGLAASASPRFLNMVFIDFKGGAGFEKLAELPHCVALETNLDAGRARRALLCLQAELDYRQRRFRAAPEPVEELHRYWMVSDEPLSRLVIVIDEMAELITVVPDFREALIRIGRIGRTLGVHLVMATQRPAEVVNSALKENTNWAIALRVREASNSVDLIGVSDAASIPPKNAAGRALLRVGGDQGALPVMFQSALSSARFDESDRSVLDVAHFAFGRSPHGAPVSPRDGARPEGVGATAETELGRLVDAMSSAFASSGDTPPRIPWQAPLAEQISLDDLIGGAATKPVGRPSTITVARADDLADQSQPPVGWDLSAGNLLIVGVVGSGTTTTLSSLALAISRSHPPDGASVYVLDLAAGGLRELDRLPCVGAVVTTAEVERQTRLVRLLVGEMLARKSAGAGGKPRIFLLIDNLGGLGNLGENGAEVTDAVQRLFSEGPDVGIMVAASADRPSAVPFKMREQTPQKWLFRLTDKTEYGSHGMKDIDPASMVPGRAVSTMTGVSMQLGMPSPSLADAVKAEAKVRGRVPKPPDVAVLPSFVQPASLHNAVALTARSWRLPVGIRNDDLSVASWELFPGQSVLVAGPGRSGKSTFLASLATVVKGADSRVTTLGLAPRAGSVLTEEGVVDVLVRNEADLVRALREYGPDRAVLVLIDDAHTLGDMEGQLGVAIRDAEPNVRFVAAGRTEEFRALFVHWTQAVRKSRTGLLLRISDPSDGDLLGGGMPFQRSYDGRPGRGFFFDDGTAELVQAMGVSAESPRRGDS